MNYFFKLGLRQAQSDIGVITIDYLLFIIVDLTTYYSLLLTAYCPLPINY
jgi:hypothetical protein